MDEGDDPIVGDDADPPSAASVASSPRADDPPDAGGPRTSVVLAACVAVAALGVAGVLAWRGRQDRDPDAAGPVPGAPPTTADGAGGPAGAAGDLLFRRVTSEDIEVRAQVNGLNGGRFDVGVAEAAVVVPPPTVLETIAVPVITDGRDVPTTTTTVTEGGEGLAAAVPTPTITVPAVSTTTPSGSDAPAAPDEADDRPDICVQVGDLTGWAISERAILQGSTPWTDGAITDLYPALMWSPDASVLGVVLQVDDAVTSVRLNGPGGASDEMAPVGGGVVLALRAEPAPDAEPGQGIRPDDIRRLYTLTAERADGSTLRSDWSTLERGHPAWGGDPLCAPDVGVPVTLPIPEPSLELPDAGAEQPADPAAARTSIEATFASLYGAPDETDPVDRIALVDDPYGIEETMAQVRENGFGEESDSAEVTIDELVFMSPTDAAFSYTLTTSGIDFGAQLGRARLIDGVWTISRATICQDLSKAGATCPP